MESRPKLVKTPHPHYIRSIIVPADSACTCPECGGATQARAWRKVKAKDAPVKGKPCAATINFQRRYCLNCSRWLTPETPLHDGFMITKGLYGWIHANAGKPQVWLRQSTGLSMARLRRILKD